MMNFKKKDLLRRQRGRSAMRKYAEMLKRKTALHGNRTRQGKEGKVK